MLTQDIDCQKCGCSNRLGTICCKNCGTKLKFNKSLLNKHKSQKVKKAIKRAFNAILVLVILIVIGMTFWTRDFPDVPKVTDHEEISAVITTCQEIDDTLARQSSKADYQFTAPELTLAANYLSLEHEIKSRQQAAMGFGTNSLGGTGKMGGASISGKVNMTLPGSNPDPAKKAYVDPEIKRKIAWMKRKQEERKNAGKPVLSPNFDFVITIKDDKTLSIVLKEIWLKFIPARLEVCVVPKLKINAKAGTKVLEYEIVSARLGHLPIPLYFKDYIISLFEEMLMQERAWAKKYFKYIKNIEIIDENIKVTIGK
jgi:hypothetical protein